MLLAQCCLPTWWESLPRFFFVIYSSEDHKIKQRLFFPPLYYNINLFYYQLLAKDERILATPVVPGV